MDLKKIFEDYVKARLAVGGCALQIFGALAILVVFPVIVWQMIENFLKDLDISWPMYLMFALLAVIIIIGVAVYKRSKVTPRQNVAVVMAGGCTAFTVATVMVFMYYDYHSVFMGILYAALSLIGWWITFSTFFPRKRKDKGQ